MLYASYKFRETPISNIMLVERVFYYVFIPGIFFASIYQCLANKEFIESAFGVIFVAIDLLFLSAGYYLYEKLLTT
jgi:predicted permease